MIGIVSGISPLRAVLILSYPFIIVWGMDGTVFSKVRIKIYLYAIVDVLLINDEPHDKILLARIAGWFVFTAFLSSFQCRKGGHFPRRRG
jgi:hypothetical protein